MPIYQNHGYQKMMLSQNSNQDSLNLLYIASTDAKQIERLKQGLQDLVLPSRKELGCLAYELFQDSKTPYRLIVKEKWIDEQAWKKHLKTPHFQAYQAMIGELTIEEEVITLTDLT